MLRWRSPVKILLIALLFRMGASAQVVLASVLDIIASSCFLSLFGGHDRRVAQPRFAAGGLGRRA
jgi:hypothetical protein